MKSEFLDSVYFQQNSFDEVDAAVDVERQTYTFNKVVKILASEFDLGNKDDARAFFNQLRQKFIDWNYSEWDGDKFKSNEKDIDELYASKNGKVSSQVAQMLKDGE